MQHTRPVPTNDSGHGYRYRPYRAATSRRGQERRCPAALAARRVAGRDDAPDTYEGCRDVGRRQLGGLVAGLGVVLGAVLAVRAIVGTDPTVQFSGYLLVLALLWVGARLVGGES